MTQVTINPVIIYENGIITSGSINSIIEEVENAIENNSNGFLYGNINRLFDITENNIPSEDYTVLINNALETFSYSSNKYTLSLVPSSPSSFVFSSAMSYAYTSQEFTSGKQYKVIGREIIFSEEITSSFSISYSGYIPNDYSANINKKTTYPDIGLIKAGKVNFPTVTKTSSTENIYSIIIPEQTGLTYSENGSSIQISGLQNTIPSNLSKYDTGNGYIDLPENVASLWIYSNGSISKVNTEYIRILTANTFEVKTSLPISISDNYIVSVMDYSVYDIIKSLYVAYRSHNHDGVGNSKRINHSDLIIANDPHKEYLLKSGYNPITNYGQITGNILVGSRSTVNINNNIEDSSYGIIFGEYNSGHILKRDSGQNGFITIDSKSSNGINVIVEDSQPGEYSKTAYKYGSFKIRSLIDTVTLKKSTVLEDDNSIIIKTNDGLQSSIISTDLLNIKTNGKITFNGVELKSTNDGLLFYSSTGKITFNSNLDINNSTITNSKINDVTVDSGKSLIFDGSGKIKNNNGKIELYGKLGIEEFSEISTVSDTNTTPVESSKYLTLKSKGPIYTIYPVEDITVNGKAYSFRKILSGYTSIDKITDWPRQDFYTGNINSYSISILDSNFTDKNGIKIGNAGRIYSSLDDTVCSFDSVVIESKDDLILLKKDDTSQDCESKEFLGIRSGSITSSGNITCEDVSSTGSISFESLSSDNFSVTKDGNINSNGSISVSVLQTTGEYQSYLYKIKTENLYVVSNLNSETATIKNLEVTKDVSVSGILNVSETVACKNINISNSLSVKKLESESIKSGTLNVADILSSGSIETSGKLKSTALEVVGDTYFSGETTSYYITNKGDINTKGLYSETGTIKKLDVSDSVTCNTIRTNSVKIDNDAEINGKLTISGQVVSGQKVSMLGGFSSKDTSEILGVLTVSGGITTTGELKSGNISSTGITVSGSAKIEGSLDISNITNVKILNVSERADFSSITIEKTLAINSGSIYGEKESMLTTGSINTAKLTITGREGYDDESNIYTDVSIYKDLTVANQTTSNILKFNSVLTSGDDETDKIYLTTSGLHFSKESSIIGVSSLTAENIIGRKNIPYTELSIFNNSTSEGIISAIQQSKFTVADNISVDGILNVPRSLVVGGTLFFNKIVPLDSTNGYLDIVSGASVYV